MVTRQAVIAAVLFGGLAAVSPGLAAMTLLIVAIIRALQHRAPAADASFLVGMFVGGLMLRLLLLAVTDVAVVWSNHLLSASMDHFTVPALMNDSGYVAIRAWREVQRLQGQLVAPEMAAEIFQNYGMGGHIYLFALFYGLFGFSPLAVTTLNCLLSVLTGLVAYALTRDLVGSFAGRIAGLLVTFFPSLVFWSITNMKDPLFILMAILLPWGWVRWHATRSWQFLLLALCSAVMLWIIRPNFIVAGAASSLVGWWLFMLKGPQRWKVTLFCAGVAILLLSRGYLQWGYYKLHHLILAYHRGVVATGGFTYRLYPDAVYDPSANFSSIGFWALLQGYGKGWLHVLFEPFPWKIHSPLSLAAVPQMVLWYPLMLTGGLGIWRLARRSWDYTVVLLIHLFMLGTVIVFGGGNVGTDFRMRDSITPLILCLSAIGLAAVRRAPEGLSP